MSSTLQPERGALLTGVQDGRKGAADEVGDWLHPELCRMAARHIRREAPGHAWRPTLVVDELYLEKEIQPGS